MTPDAPAGAWRPAWLDQPWPESASQPAESALPFRALLAFLVILLLAPQNLIPALAPLRIALLTALVAIAAYLFDCLMRGRPFTVVTRELVVAGLLVSWAVATVPFSLWPGGSVSFLFDIYLKAVAVFVLLANTATSTARLRKVAWTLSLVSIPMAITAVVNFATGNYDRIERGGVGRIYGYESGLAYNPNDLALTLNLILPLVLALLLESRGTVPRMTLLGCVGLIVVAVMVTFSRAGFLTLTVIVAVTLFKLFRRGHAGWAATGLAVFLASLALFPGQYLGRLGTIVDIDSDPTGSAQARRDDSFSAMRIIAANPIVGAGVGQDVLALNEERGAAWKSAHNAYLQIGTELGLPGLGLFLVLFFGCLRVVRAVQRRALAGGSRELLALADGIQMALVAFAVAALFHPIAYQFYFYLLAGLAVGAGIASREVTPGA